MVNDSAQKQSTSFLLHALHLQKRENLPSPRRLISGTGPSEGWISTQIAGKTLAVKLEEAPGAAADGSWSTEGTGSMPPELATILEKGTKHVTACACDQENGLFARDNSM